MANFLSEALEREHEELLANHNVVPVYENSLKKETAKPDHTRVKLDQFHSAILEQEKSHEVKEIPAPKLKAPEFSKKGNYGETFDEYRLHSTIKPVILEGDNDEEQKSEPVQEVTFIKNPDEIKERVGRILVVDKHEDLVEKNAIKPVYVPITTKDFEQGLPKLVPQSSALIEIKDLSELDLPSVFYSEDEIAQVLIKTENYDYLDRYSSDITGVHFLATPGITEINPYIATVPDSQVDYKKKIDPYLSTVPDSKYLGPQNTETKPYRFTTCFGTFTLDVKPITGLDTGIDSAYDSYGGVIDENQDLHKSVLELPADYELKPTKQPNSTSKNDLTYYKNSGSYVDGVCVDRGLNNNILTAYDSYGGVIDENQDIHKSVLELPEGYELKPIKQPNSTSKNDLTYYKNSGSYVDGVCVDRGLNNNILTAYDSYGKAIYGNISSGFWDGDGRKSRLDGYVCGSSKTSFDKYSFIGLFCSDINGRTDEPGIDNRIKDSYGYYEKGPERESCPSCFSDQSKISTPVWKGELYPGVTEPYKTLSGVGNWTYFGREIKDGVNTRINTNYSGFGTCPYTELTKSNWTSAGWNSEWAGSLKAKSLYYKDKEEATGAEAEQSTWHPYKVMSTLGKFILPDSKIIEGIDTGIQKAYTKYGERVPHETGPSRLKDYSQWRRNGRYFSKTRMNKWTLCSYHLKMYLTKLSDESKKIAGYGLDTNLYGAYSNYGDELWQEFKDIGYNFWERNGRKSELKGPVCGSSTKAFNKYSVIGLYSSCINGRSLEPGISNRIKDSYGKDYNTNPYGNISNEFWNSGRKISHPEDYRLNYYQKRAPYYQFSVYNTSFVIDKCEITGIDTKINHAYSNYGKNDDSRYRGSGLKEEENITRITNRGDQRILFREYLKSYMDAAGVWQTRGILGLKDPDSGDFSLSRDIDSINNNVNQGLSALALGKLGHLTSLIETQINQVRAPSLMVKGILPVTDTINLIKNLAGGQDPTSNITNIVNNVTNIATFKTLWDPLTSLGMWSAYSLIPTKWIQIPRFSLLAYGGLVGFQELIKKLHLDKLFKQLNKLPPKVRNVAIRNITKNWASGIGNFAFMAKYGPVATIPTVRHSDATMIFTDLMNNLGYGADGWEGYVVPSYTEGTDTSSDYSKSLSNDDQINYLKSQKLVGTATQTAITKPFTGKFTKIVDGHLNGETGVNFGTEFYWDMLFSYPSVNANLLPEFPYKGWMPVQSYSLTGTSMGTMTVNTLAGDVTVPDMYKLPTAISITIPETSWMSVDKWLRAYFAAVFRGASTYTQTTPGDPILRILPYKNQTLYITIYWMNEQWIVLRKKTFICIPDLKFSYQGQSSKDVKTHDIQFNIVGTRGLSQVEFTAANGSASNYVTMLE